MLKKGIGLKVWTTREPGHPHSGPPIPKAPPAKGAAIRKSMH
jgi:hypothetical protein